MHTVSSSIHVVALAHVSLQHHDAVIQALRELAKLSREEKGCLRYDIFCDTKNPMLINTIEEWQDEDALQQHLRSTHVTQTIRSVLDKLAEIPQIRILRSIESL